MITQWHKAPADLQASQDYIDIWSTSLDLSEEEVDNFAEILSQDEIQRAERFVFPKKYREYVITRGVLRRSLALVSGSTPEDLQFDYTEHDKPYLKRGNISFNVSHSHGHALVAIGLNRNIGIDIEKIRKDVEYEKLAKRFFSINEYSALMEIAKPDREKVFYTIWTRKEAFVKAIGKGISFGLSEFDVAIEPDVPAALTSTRWDPAAVSLWKMANIDVNNNYMAALATDGGDFELRYWTI